MTMDRHIIPAIILLFSLSAVSEAQVDAEFRPPDAADDATSRYQAQSGDQTGSSAPIALRIALPEVTNSERATWELQQQNQPRQIGFGREIPAAYSDDLAPLIEWTTLSDGTLSARLSVTSPGASALRIAVYASLDPGAELRFFSLDESAQRFEPLTERDFSEPPAADESSEQDPLAVWSPVIEGETVGIEITLPSSAALSTFSLFVDQVSHILQSISAPQDDLQALQPISAPQYGPQALRDVGNAVCSHINVQCRDVDPQASATAKMIYTTRQGRTSLCTGVLMNDTDRSSFIPYFLTAHHCIATQAVARTLVTYWDFERSRCGGSDPTTVTQLTGGTDLLATDSWSDSTLLRLRRNPPSGPDGRWYAGWDARSLNHPSAVYGVHHPSGDLKKYSAGTTAGHQPIPLGPERQWVLTIFVRWSQGTTQGGSSGSGLFDRDGLLRGVLSGAPPNMTCPSTTVYGRFDLFFRHARYWLTTDPTDDHGNTSAQATSVALGSSTQGRLEQPGDIDYFRFEVSVAGTLTVFTTGNTDTYGSLRDNGQWYHNDDSGAGYNFYVERRAASIGVHYVRVSGYGGYTTGPYTLHVRFTPTGGGPSTIVWSITDECNDGYRIEYRFFQGPRDSSTFTGRWPASGGIYHTLRYGETYTSRLGCTPGYLVCYGARTGSGHWGVDIDGNQGCDACCDICPTSGTIEVGRRLTCPNS